MAKQVKVILTDDIDGGEATQSVSFALDGVSYNIDLSDKNAAKLRKSLEQYIASGERDRSATAAAAANKRGRGRASTDGGPSATSIREWAAAEGMEVSARGRVSADLKQAYAEAHAGA